MDYQEWEQFNKLVGRKSMIRSEEIKAVKELGSKIGYGNMMDIASALWANSLEETCGTDSGAFVPVILQYLKKKDKIRTENRLKFMKAEVKDSLIRG